MNGQRFFGDGEAVPVPFPARTAIAVGGFVVCPMPFGFLGGESRGWMEDVYRLAYEQAVSATRPSWFERLIEPSRN